MPVQNVQPIASYEHYLLNSLLSEEKHWDEIVFPIMGVTQETH